MAEAVGLHTYVRQAAVAVSQESTGYPLKTQTDRRGKHSTTEEKSGVADEGATC